MSTKIAVNLPVKDIAKSTHFFIGLGFARDKQLANENVQAVIVSDDITVLLVNRAHFQAITKRQIADRATTSEVVLQLQVENRQRVDGLAEKAFAAGAPPAKDPIDQGFLYGRSFRDPDGHHWDVFCIHQARET